MHKYDVVGKDNFSRESCLTNRSDLSEGVNGYLDKSGLVNIVYLSFFQSTFSKVPWKKKAILFIV